VGAVLARCGGVGAAWLGASPRWPRVARPPILCHALGDAASAQGEEADAAETETGTEAENGTVEVIADGGGDAPGDDPGIFPIFHLPIGDGGTVVLPPDLRCHRVPR
jgi:hypothetical protein